MSSHTIVLLSNKLDAPSEKVKKASRPLPKKSDAQIEKVKKASGYLDDIKNPLVTTKYIVDKKGRPKQNMVEEANTSPI